MECNKCKWKPKSTLDDKFIIACAFLASHLISLNRMTFLLFYSISSRVAMSFTGKNENHKIGQNSLEIFRSCLGQLTSNAGQQQTDSSTTGILLACE